MVAQAESIYFGLSDCICIYIDGKYPEDTRIFTHILISA